MYQIHAQLQQKLFRLNAAIAANRNWHRAIYTRRVYTSLCGRYVGCDFSVLFCKEFLECGGDSGGGICFNFGLCN